MYKKIEVHNTEYLDKYLLILDDKTLYIGIIVKDIVMLLKKGTQIETILTNINVKYKTQFIEEDIINITSKIDTFITKEEKTNLFKLLKVFNPNNLFMPKIILKIFSKEYFYIIFTFLLLINILVYFYFQLSNQLYSTYENSIVFIVLVLILFFHELGHSISSRNYSINVKEIGFGLYYIFPVFYTNLNEIWKLNKEKRTIINLSGIYLQLIIGMLFSILIFTFNKTPILISIFRINVYIILANFNPFLKFDGYWIISDLLGENNLLKTSNELIQTKFKLKKTNEYKYQINIFLYTILRIIFIIYLFYMIFKNILNIIPKYLRDEELNSNEYIFIFILLLYSITLTLRKLT